MLDARQLETEGFGSKPALQRFPCESPEGNFADEARNFSCRICSIDKPRMPGDESRNPYTVAFPPGEFTKGVKT